MTDDSVEPPEHFRVTLRDSQGGAGLGTTGVTVEIAADGSPFGQLAFSDTAPLGVQEIGGYLASVMVSREFNASGVVSVTVTPISGGATADVDFVADPITLTWADGEWGQKVARIRIIDDPDPELAEDFTVQLSNPTGGAVLGSRSTMTLRIYQNDRPTVPTGSGGGGAFGFLSLALLGFLRTMRRFMIGSRATERS
jgi:hypothetical protein